MVALLSDLSALVIFRPRSANTIFLQLLSLLLAGQTPPQMSKTDKPKGQT
jgi:hypothetical protein